MPTSSRFLALPNELLLGIISQLQLNRTVERTTRDTLELGSENQKCLSAFHSLCLSCRKLRSVAEPFLYSAYFFYPGHSIRRLACYLRTMIARPALRLCLDFIWVSSLHNCDGKTECPLSTANYQSEGHRESFQKTTEHEEFCSAARAEAQRIWSEEQLGELEWRFNLLHKPDQAFLALVIACTNVQELVVFSACEGTSVERLLGLNIYTKLVPLRCHRPFPKLSSFIFIAPPWRPHTSNRPVFHYSATRFPSLQYVQLNGHAEITYDAQSQTMPVQTLRLLERNGTNLWPVQDHPSLSVLVNESEIFTAFGDRPFEHVYAMLSVQRNSLKILWLNIACYSCEHILDLSASFQPMESLSSFTALEILRIPSAMLLGSPLGFFALGDPVKGSWWNTSKGGVRISKLLPGSLRHLVIADEHGLTEDALVLGELADDCYNLRHLLSVRLIEVESTFTNLASKFAAHGVAFSSAQESDSLDLYSLSKVTC